MNRPIVAAEAIDLRHQPIARLQSILTPKNLYSPSLLRINLQELSRDLDMDRKLHIRFQQMYGEHPILGTGSIIHVPNHDQAIGKNSLYDLVADSKNASMNGILYQNLDADLQNTPNYIFQKIQMDKALDQAIFLYQHKMGNSPVISAKQIKLYVYVDQDHKAHWVYYIQFYARNSQTIARPSYILEAQTFKVYHEFDAIQKFTGTKGGGFGGNKQNGKLSYDGMPGHFASLSIYRDDNNKICFLENASIAVLDMRKNTGDDQYAVEQYRCDNQDPTHNNLFWNNDSETNGGFSVRNDALYGAQVVSDMFREWYNLPVLIENNKAMKIIVLVHGQEDGKDIGEHSYWDGKQVILGDGGAENYPYTSLDIIGHELGHGFTYQQIGLMIYQHSAAINESFADMTAKAAEYYVTKKNDWRIGATTSKTNKALRYFDHPSLDCEGRKPGDNCSIEHVKDLPPIPPDHFSEGGSGFYSGITNKAFYLIATADGWNTKKAYDVMVEANRHYWTVSTSFQDAACGVIKATRAKPAKEYPIEAVTHAFAEVGIDTSTCS